ncbi:hypothetical protein G3I13_07250 [Streptomyces sp. SID6673]|nr:hypothetical protein [Streptomyces sp. SID11726]NEB24122.1 hypothetical protein [Streptomyces sp. SID6673]
MLALAYCIATAGILYVSLFAVMGTASCSDARPCDYDKLTAGHAVLWGGSAIIALLMVIGMIAMLVVRRLTFWIPLSAIVLEVPVVALAIALAEQMQ